MVITNSHCISTSAEAPGARVAFNDEDGAGKLIWYACSTPIRSWGNGSEDDITALRCQPHDGVYPGETYGYLSVSNTDVGQGTPIYVVHQNCNCEADEHGSATKKYAPDRGNNVSVKMAVRGSIVRSHLANIGL